MAKKKFSAKDIDTLLDFSGETGQAFTGLGVPEASFQQTENELFSNFMQTFQHKSNLDIIDSVLPNINAKQDIREEVRTDDDGKIRRYRVTRDQEGAEIDKYLIDPVESVSIDDALTTVNPYTAKFHKDKLFNMMREDIDPVTGEFKSGIGKGFWENSLDNSLTYQLGKLGASLIAGEQLGQYGIDQTYFNSLSFRGDGVYYRDQLISKDPDEVNLINEYFGRKIEYEADNFLDLFANTASTFAMDVPLFMVSGGLGSKVLGTVLPGVVNASHLPGKLVGHMLQNSVTLGLAQAPAIINHTIESGTDAFLEDLLQLGKFSVMASAFGVTGETIGTGISHLLRQPKNLSMSQATTFLRRNPKIVQNLTGGVTSFGLGYAATDGSTEDRLATGLTFMSLHFANPQAWKSYVTKDQKNVMVEKDAFDLLRLGVKSGRTLTEAITETGAEVPRYFEREGNNLYLIDQNKFSGKGTVERVQEEPISLSKANATDYAFISEVVPFARKTFKQSFEDADRTKAVKTVWEKKFKDIKNPYDKVTEKDAYESFELNKQMSASVLGHLIYSQKLTKALRKNQLPEDIKLDKFINETSAFFELPERVFKSHIKDDMLRYINDPKKFFEEGAYKFTPEEYKKLFTDGFKETLDAYERKAINEEVNRIFAIKELRKDAELEKRTEIQNAKQKAVIEADAKTQEIQNREEPKQVKREEITPEEQAGLEKAAIRGKLEKAPAEGELVTETGERLIGTEGAGLTEAERKAFGRQKTGIKVKETVDKLTTIPELNEALEKANSPVEIVRELQKRFTEKPIEGKKEPTKKIEEEAEIKAEEEQKSKTQKRNERKRKVRKLKAQKFQEKTLEERATELFSKEELAEARKLGEREFREKVEDKFLETTKPKEAEPSETFKEAHPEYEAYRQIEAEQEPTPKGKVTEEGGVKIREAETSSDKIVRDVQEKSKKVRGQIEEIESKFKGTPEELNALRFEKEGELKSLYDKILELDTEKHTRLQEDREANMGTPEGSKRAVLLEDGRVISQDVSSHLKMKFSEADRKIIVDIGVIDKEGKFKSTAIIDPEDFKTAIGNIALNSGKNIVPFKRNGAQLLSDYATVGAYLFERGFNKFKFWSAEMLRRFGKGLGKFLGGIWQGTKAVLTGEKILLDPNTLGTFGMQSGKEFNELRAGLGREQTEAQLRQAFEESGIKGDYKGIIKGKGGVPQAVTFDIVTDPQGNKSSITMRLGEGKITAAKIRELAKEKITDFGKLETPEKITKLKQEATTTGKIKPTGIETEGKPEPSVETISETIFAPKNKMSSGEKKVFKSIVSKLERYKPKKIKGRLVGTTLTADEHSKLHNIRKVVAVEPTEKEGLTKKVIEDLAEIEMKPEHTATDRQQQLDLQELFENLTRFGAIKDMRGEQLKFANEGLKEIIEEGRTKRRAKEEARLKRRNAILEKGKEDIGTAVSVAKARQLGFDTEKPGFLRKISEFDNRMLGFEFLLKKFSKKSDFLADYFYKKQVKSANEQQDSGIRTHGEALEAKLKEIYGVEKGALSKELAKNNERKKTKAFITEGEEKIELELSQNEAYKKWMEWQDPTVRPTMEEMGFSEQTMKQLNDFMTPKVREWAKWQIEEFYPTYYKGVNEAFRERFGVDLPFNKFYSPIERIATKETIDNPLLARGSQYATVVNQHLKMRVNSRAELKYLDGDEVLMKHIAEMEHFKAWVEPIREMRSVFGDKTFRQALAQQQGEKALKILDEFVDDLARGGSDRSKSYQLLDKVRRNFTRAVIGMNPVVFAKQLTSFPAFAADIPTADFLSGIADFVASPVKNMKILMESEMMKTRYNAGAMDRDVKDVLSKNTNKQLAGAKSVSDALMLMTKMGDRGAIVFGGWSVFRYHKNKLMKGGMPEAQAHKKAMREFEVTVERMQQSGRIEDLSSIQRSGSIGKLFTMFMTAPNAYYRVASGAFRDIARGKGSKSENVKKLAIAHFVLPMLFQFAADGFTFSEKRQLRAAALGSLNGLLVIGDFLEAGFSGMQGDFHFNPEGTPVIQAPQHFIEALDKMGAMISKDSFETDEVLKFADKMASGMSKFGGIPYDTFQRSIQAGIEGKDLRQLIGYSEVALKQTQDDTKKYKKLADAWRKRYKKDPTPENYATYLEYRKDYRRLLTQLKQTERNK